MPSTMDANDPSLDTRGETVGLRGKKAKNF